MTRIDPYALVYPLRGYLGPAFTITPWVEGDQAGLLVETPAKQLRVLLAGGQPDARAVAGFIEVQFARREVKSGDTVTYESAGSTMCW